MTIFDHGPVMPRLLFAATLKLYCTPADKLLIRVERFAEESANVAHEDALDCLYSMIYSATVELPDGMDEALQLSVALATPACTVSDGAVG